MPVADEQEAERLAASLAAEMVAALDPGMLSEARAMGMAASVFAGQIEEYRTRFNAQVTPDLVEKDLFGVAASRLLIEE